MIDYRDFVTRKLDISTPSGIEPTDLSKPLFPHQRDLTAWALRRGRAAIFAATGLGKTMMEIEWARHVATHTGKPVLILCPLAVAPQIVAESRRFSWRTAIGECVRQVRDRDDIGSAQIVTTNYDRLHRFDPKMFGGVVLDESSIIKHHDAQSFGLLTESFAQTPFRLCATATPAPNDYMELGTHAEFLGICRRTEMLSEYFVHDGGDTQTWRLKKHARTAFWRFVASWGALIRMPSDLGYPDDGFILPNLSIRFHRVDAGEVETAEAGLLFALPARTMSERRAARKASVDHRAAECAAMVNADRQPWVVWCDLNYEADALAALIPDAVEIRGSDPIEQKERSLTDFSTGKIRVLITKPTIAGWGLNWQHCARMAFVGVSDSWEQYHQAIRRCWRFGQKRPVEVHAFASDLEGEVLSNLRRKESDAERMAAELARETGALVRSSVLGQRSRPRLPDWHRPSFPTWIRTEAS